MSKRGISNRGKRRELERQLKKGNSVSKTPPALLFYNIKYKLNAKQGSQLLQTLPPDLTALIKNASLPKSYTDLRKDTSIFLEDNFFHELNWIANDLIQHSDRINKFIQLEKDFENNFLKGSYSEARNVIESIESEICVSHYSIEKKLLLSEYEFGFKRNKEELTEILNEKRDTVVEILAKHQSIRVEKNLSFFKYEEMVNKYIDNYSESKFKEYFRFKLNYFSKNKAQNLGFILHIDDASSIIDKYLSLIILICENLSSTKTEQQEKALISNILEKINSVINDSRIQNLMAKLGTLNDLRLSPEETTFIAILDKYTAGDYLAAKEKAATFLTSNPIFFDLYDILIRSSENLDEKFVNIFPEESVANYLLNDVYNIIIKNDDTQNSIINLHKIFNTVGLNSWTYRCHAFFCKEHSFHDPEFNVHACAELYSNYVNPRLAFYIEDKSYSEKFLRLFDSKLSNSNVIQFWKKIVAETQGKTLVLTNDIVSEYRNLIYNIWTIQLKGDYKTALFKYGELLKNQEYSNHLARSFNTEDIYYGILLCYHHLDDKKNALQLISKIIIENPNLLNKFRYTDLLQQILLFEDENLFGEISVPVLLHQYQNNVSLNDIWVAYDNFLNHYGLNYPKEIEQIKDQFPRDKLLYFLKNICRQEVYYSSYFFSNQDDLDNERIEICILLTQLDPENTKNYLDEISEISRNQLIRRGVKQIDESKIYVDVKGLYNLLRKDLIESFERSQNLLSLSIDQIQKLDTNKENVIVPYYGKSNDTNKVEPKKENIKVASYSRFQEFTDMFTKVRDKFIASNEYGIDTYLSMRIRHGTLLSEIRSVFEKHSLITKKDETSNSYLENEYWCKKDFYNNPLIKTPLKNILSKFSSEIDLVSEELKNKKIQIKTENKNTEGLFDYSFDTKEMLTLFKNKLGAIEDFDEFFEAVIAVLWDRTEKNLFIIRESISEKIKDHFLKLLTELNSSLETLIDKSDYPDVNELIRNVTTCQTDITYELQKIASWFNRSHSKTINEFYLDLPIAASLATLKRFKDFSNFNPSIENNCDLKFDGEYFPAFADLMQNLLHNILLHSKLPCTEIAAKIDITISGQILTLVVQNRISNSIDLLDHNLEIEETRKRLNETHDSEKIRGERKSGYLKILKTVKTDLSRETFEISLSDISDERIFVTTIKFPFTNLLKVEA